MHDVASLIMEFHWLYGKYLQWSPFIGIGGVDVHTQLKDISRGLHIVIATPGRLKDMLSKKRFSLDLCKFLVLDEADRMIDLGFEDDVREIMFYFKVTIELHKWA